jgi:hypothetical protein
MAGDLTREVVGRGVEVIFRYNAVRRTVRRRCRCGYTLSEAQLTHGTMANRVGAAVALYLV